MPIPQQDLSEFNEIINKWARQFSAQRKYNLRKKKLIASGKLQDSIDEDIAIFSSGMVAEIMFKFQFYGRFYDFKKVKFAGANRATVTALQQWIKTLGVGKFANSDRYSKLPQDDEKKIKSIGWAIANSLARKRWKPRKWFNTNRRYDTATLEKILLDKWSDVILTESVASLKK